jgi:hypothetical protein
MATRSRSSQRPTTSTSDTGEESGPVGTAQEKKPVTKWTPAQLGVLVQALFNNRFLPVLIFGAKKTGKTVLLCSLINYLRANPHGMSVQVNFFDLKLRINGEPFAAGETMLNNAFELFREIADQSMHSLPGETSVTEEPFFVPLEISFSGNSQPPLRLAFVDASGEHLFDINGTGKNRARTPYGQLRAPVEAVISGFRSALSFIYVVSPGTLLSKPTGNIAPTTLEEERNNDLGLGHLISTQYPMHRPADFWRSDRHMFLISQWDESVNWQSVRFLWPKQRRLLNDYSAHYPRTWSAFLSLQGSKNWMPYSGTLAGQGGAVSANQLSRERLGIFANRLLAWVAQGFVSSFKSELRSDMERSREGSGAGVGRLFNQYFPQQLSPRKHIQELTRQKYEAQQKTAEAQAATEAALAKVKRQLISSEAALEALRAEADRAAMTEAQMQARQSATPSTDAALGKVKAVATWLSFVLVAWRVVRSLLRELFETSLATA